MSTDLLTPPVAIPAAPEKRKKRRRRRFSLNGLAIQLSAFALSFTLVALLVVSGSQQAFVEENEAVTDYVPIGSTDAPTDDGPTRRSPGSPAPTGEAPVPLDEPAPTPAPDVVEMPSTVIRLADTDAGTAMFGGETVLAPGVTSDRCIQVDYSGDLDPEPVRLYAAAVAGDLAPYLDLAIDIGDATSGAFGDCGTFVPTGSLYSGSLADFATGHSGYFTGIDTWDPSHEEEIRTFRFTVSVQDDPAAEGRSVGFGFSWETRDRA
jgi:hypothetical protein